MLIKKPLTMNRIGLPLLALLLLNIPGFSQISPNKEITVKELEHHVLLLSSDSLKGRLAGTIQDRIVAKYIRDEFRKYGLAPLGEEGYQFFDMQRTNSGWEKSTHFTINGKALTYGVDFTAYPASRGTDSLCAGAVFVEYGLTHCYANVGVQRKWVAMILSNPPDSNSTYIGRINQAVQRSAAGIILLADNESSTPPLFLLGGCADYQLPIIILGKNASNYLLQSIGNIDRIKYQINTEHKQLAQDIPATICGKVGNSLVQIKTQNVVATIKGSHSKFSEEYIVIGAHYDHLGMGGSNSGSATPDTIAVHNGADDNASGIAALLEIAQKMQSQAELLKRSVVFIGFGAEEQGLMGSKRFLEEEFIPTHSIKGMINMDMIGRLSDSRLEIAGATTSKQTKAIINHINSDSALRIVYKARGTGISDHIPFYNKRIPSIFLTTGMHPDYHTPRDVPSKINYNGLRDVSILAHRLVHHLCNMDSSLVFKSSANEQLRDLARNKVQLGIIPDLQDWSIDGVRVIDTIGNSPASEAGMEKGDIIISINSTTIFDIDDYVQLTKQLKMRVPINVTVMRNGTKVGLEILP